LDNLIFIISTTIKFLFCFDFCLIRDIERASRNFLVVKGDLE